MRPYIGTRLLKPLQPLEVQAIYDQLAVGGRKDGKPGGLDAQHILAVHRCLHRALEQAITWRLRTDNPAKHATPPPVPHKDTMALLPEQVDPARVNFSEAEFLGNHCVVAVSSLGSLIQTAVGSAGGWGGLRTKRSGWAA